MTAEKIEKSLGAIAIGFGLYVAYNLWGGVFEGMLCELIKHSIHF